VNDLIQWANVIADVPADAMTEIFPLQRKTFLSIHLEKIVQLARFDAVSAVINNHSLCSLVHYPA
jgi:hypothetical protein